MPSPKFPTVEVATLASNGVVPDRMPPPPLVLVVDDEPVIADTLVEILMSEGFAATAAYSGEDAAQIASLTPPDLLLSDVMMGGMNGIELAMEMQKLAPDCRILLLSGQAAAVNLLAKSPASVDKLTVLPKPIHPAELLLEISRVGINPRFRCPPVRPPHPRTERDRKPQPTVISPESRATPELNDSAAVALRGPGLRDGLELALGAALFGRFLPEGAALVGFTI
jgi:CheY-like chemotaxis protein